MKHVKYLTFILLFSPLFADDLPQQISDPAINEVSNFLRQDIVNRGFDRRGCKGQGEQFCVNSDTASVVINNASFTVTTGGREIVLSTGTTSGPQVRISSAGAVELLNLSVLDNMTVSSMSVTNNLTLKQNGDLIITAGISGNSLYMSNDTGELNISTGTTVLFTGQGDGDWVVAKNIYIGREMLNSGGCGSCLSVNQTCSAGKVVLGGGCAGGGAGNAFVNNFPNADNSWFCETESAANITVWVICARMQ